MVHNSHSNSHSKNHVQTSKMQQFLSTGSAKASAWRAKHSPVLLAHTAAVTVMTVFMLWVFTHYKLVPYS
jgi:hypothetical protein